MARASRRSMGGTHGRGWGDNGPERILPLEWAKRRLADTAFHRGTSGGDSGGDDQKAGPRTAETGLRYCPSWDRTRTLLIQSQTCCQLHQGAVVWTGEISGTGPEAQFPEGT